MVYGFGCVDAEADLCLERPSCLCVICTDFKGKIFIRDHRS